jgi:hypothetical protein
MARSKQPRQKKAPPPPTPKTPKPSDQLPWLPEGEAQADSIHLAVGRALHTWELMESALARIFGALVQSRAEGALRAYGSVVSFSGRKDMLTMAFECYPKKDDPIASAFPNLLDEIKEFSARRNEIAHGIAKEFYSHEFGKQPTSRGSYLVAPWYGSKKQSSVSTRSRH